MSETTEFKFNPPTEKRIDDRRNKEYKIKVTWRTDLPDFRDRDDRPERRHAWESRYSFMREALDKEFADVVKTEGISFGRTACEYYYRHTNFFTVELLVCVKADRPKNILSLDAVVALLPPQSELDARLNRAYQATMTWLDDAELAEETKIGTAQSILAWLSGAAAKKAREICRYEQKLAALRAEMKAEALVQMASLVESQKERVREEIETDNEPWDEEMWKLVVAHAPEYMGDWVQESLSPFPRSSSENWLRQKLKKED